MERIGLIDRPLEANIFRCTLKFKDPLIESSYIDAQTSLKLLSTATRKFLLIVLIGDMVLHVVSLFSASKLNSIPISEPSLWINHGLILLTYVLEALFYWYAPLFVARGLAITIFGALVLFQDNFYTFESQAFYPFIGTE